MRSGVFLTPYMESDVNLTLAVFGSYKNFVVFTVYSNTRYTTNYPMD